LTSIVERISRRRALVSGAVVLLTGWIAAPTASARPAFTCSRLGQRVVADGYLYTCVRRRGRLVWKKGRPVPGQAAPVATPAPSATASPTRPTSPVAVRVTAASAVPEGRPVFEIVLDRDGRPRELALVRSGASVRAFDARCTHAGCIVAVGDDRDFVCRCHGSAFDGSTGAVLLGPAREPLAQLAVTTVDGDIYVSGL
jgi:Rieske Fe-S protein